MTPRMPHLAAPPTQAGVVTADEFNLWCALNGRPFNLVPNPRPDGRVMWDVEVLPGTPRAGTVYSTNLSDEALAVVAGFAFLSGVEWAYEARDPAEAEAPAAAPCEAAPAAAAPAPAPVSAAVAPCAPAAPAAPAEPVEYPAVYSLPAVSLLQNPPPRPVQQHDESVLARNARMLETVLKNFRVRGEIMDVRPGPVVTLYEFEPAPGTKSATVINLTDDIARSMSVVTARIAIVPGRSVIGVELPNPVREMVYLRESFDHDAFRNTTAQLAIALGKDISGEPVVADLARMPHLLVAGTTGSGKSVAINTMILSLLYRLPPERCRFIMVDPKMLELSVYDGIPHLLTPVVTDPKKAVVALRWAVREMESRYEAMSKLGVRNIEGYNARMAEMIAAGEKMPRRTPAPGEPENVFDLTPSEPTPLPYIVVIVDEMADLMLVAGKEIEAAIQRLAQMARAAGIHLIMATQRPSVDVITGTIKANFPTRISFQVTSKIDSRTILGEAGAEQLLGQGDMLYMQGGGRITRVHGPFVSDSEVEEIVQYVKAQGAPNYVTAITEEEEETAAVEDEDGGSAATGDDLYMQAVNLVVREGKVSVSFIQRQLQIGYNRAARLVERMETERVVGPANHQGKREVLLSHAGLSAKRAGV
ncbi:DNA segregation ATPase FtsK/SpoIIIE, S-DNA-T family [Azospirillum oryzae]|uniref:DNA segregation ATPase FtsK/SpoIIIE, S-DNA-T family n=1 Tax=Azospirillum oryzae TaxID=286727 RepID=A0A1X7HCM7_9PROT|nr:DNA translocase FtsK [Azospirillum oryzae]SMF84020.1 DNA segregation ATPase FtsK/SpoIIIE, S-DNA-T family [Azospirillum oryzae]